MHTIQPISYLCVFFIFLFGNTMIAQGIFTSKVYENKTEDPSWQEVQRHRDRLEAKIQMMTRKIEMAGIEERKQFLNLIYNIRNGVDSIVDEQLQNPEIREIIVGSEYGPEKIKSMTIRSKRLSERNDKLTELYSNKYLLDHTMPLYRNADALQREISKYDFNNNDQILQVESGSINFARELGYRIRDAEIYINDSDSLVLRTMYSILQWDEELKDIQSDRNNVYIIVAGTARNTGMEDRTYDRIIMRNNFHQLAHPGSMLASISRSMNKSSSLFIRESFRGDCEGNDCGEFWTQQAFEEQLEQSGFQEVDSGKWRGSQGMDYWIYEYRLSE